MRLTRTVGGVFLIVLLASSCNTCKNGANIAFRGDPASTADVADVGMDAVVEDVASDATIIPDMPAPTDMDQPDGPDTCVPETVTTACANVNRTCGAYAWVDNCGQDRDSDCGVCDPNSSACGAVGTCECLQGFQDVGGVCQDINECDNGTAMCPDGEFCVNQPGTFMCSDCPAGQVSANGVCVDLNECDTGDDNCDPLVECTNEVPFFSCGACPAGYNDQNGDGTFCVDINECATNTDNCDDLVTCTNETPGFSCGACPAGYRDTFGDGTDCEDIDECADGTDQCDVNANCFNETPGYRCECVAPFVGDGFTCSNGLVTSVTHLRAAMNGTTEFIPIPNGIDLTKVVPFATVTAETDGSYDQALVRVRVDQNGQRIQLTRGSSEGDIVAVVTLVEFGDAVVQSGSYGFSPNGASVSTQTLPTVVDPASAFVVFSHFTSVDTNFASDVSVRAELTANSIRFEREDDFAGMSGIWYVVSSPAHLKVQHGSDSFQSASVCEAEALNSVVMSQAFVLHSQQISLFASSDPVEHHTYCDLENSTTVLCCRAKTDLTSTPTVGYQVVEVVGAAVQRGELFFASDSAVEAISSVDTNWSMSLLSSVGMVGAAATTEDLPDTSEHAAFVTLELASSTSLVVERRENPPVSSLVWWQVIEWPH